MYKLDENAFNNHALCLVKVCVDQQGGQLQVSAPHYTLPTLIPERAIVFFKNVTEHKKLLFSIGI